MTKRFKRLKYDFRMIIREPIMLLFSVLPLFIMVLFRFGLPPLSMFIESRTGFNLMEYEIYFTVFVFVMTPYMTGTLAGFLMLDERDGNMFELLLTTPPGFRGYLFSRLLVPVTLSVIYTCAGFLFYPMLKVSLLPGILALVIIQSWITALILFSVAKNKVQGLTMAKALGLLFAPVFFSLLNNRFLDLISGASPFYWLYHFMDTENHGIFWIGLGVNLIWLVMTLVLGYRRTYRIKTTG